MKIIGVMMVKNEDRWIRKALQAIGDFCDSIILIDTGSTDYTRREAARTCVLDEYHLEPDLSRTHRFVEQYVGTDTWVFGVDGDEIYDREGLKIVRQQIDGGCLRGVFQAVGQYLHVVHLANGQARGYAGPPSHTPTKLYNFKNLQEWPSDGKHSLFQARTRVVKANIERDTFYQQYRWTACPLRCLHMRFMRRSWSESDAEIGTRLSGEDRLGFGSRGDRGGTDERNERMSYRKGEIVEVASWL